MNDSIQTLIIGKNSNFSHHLKKGIENSLLLSTLNVKSELEAITFNTKVNIIFNNFQSAIKLNDLSSPIEYLDRAIMATSIVLEYVLNEKIKINKMIYTSSSAVYGNNIFCNETDMLVPLNLHASLKVANEKLIMKFCDENDIDYIIARVFNMYGGEDKFSIVSKIVKSHKEKGILQLINNGNGIRDYIHIEDVVNIYKELLTKTNIGIVNVGTGEGVSVKSILDYLKHNNITLNINSVQREELKISTSNNAKLLQRIGNYHFKNVEEYILEAIYE